MTFALKRPRINDDRHLQFIRELPCACCGDATSTEAAHLRASDLFYGKRKTGMQEKPSDKWCLPLCGTHHREQHAGNELRFWKNYGIDPFVLALSLHACSGEHQTAEHILALQRGAR